MFSCIDCNVHYKSQKGLDSHNEKHLGITYDCQECGKKCTQKSNLIVHLKGVHNAVTHSCKYFSGHFTDQSIASRDWCPSDNGSNWLSGIWTSLLERSANESAGW